MYQLRAIYDSHVCQISNMRIAFLITLIIFFFVMMAGHAFAYGEVFRVETTGTKYCGDFNHEMFGPRNKLDLWIQILSKTQIIFSFTSDFEPETTFTSEPGTAFAVNGLTNLYDTNEARFSVSVSFEDGSYASFIGRLHFDNYETVEFVKGRFIENNILHPGCFSYGSFWTMERLQ